jgi:predicted outer membrane protein
MQLQGHQEAIALYATYARRPDNPALAGFARRTLPHLRMHRAMAQRL